MNNPIPFIIDNPIPFIINQPSPLIINNPIPFVINNPIPAGPALFHRRLRAFAQCTNGVGQIWLACVSPTRKNSTSHMF